MSKNGYLHHISKKALQHSANGGCEGCAIIFSQKLNDLSQWYALELVPPENTLELPYTQIVCTAVKEKDEPKFWGLRFWQPNLVERKQCVW
jgi:hypothetical protein